MKEMLKMLERALKALEESGCAASLGETGDNLRVSSEASKERVEEILASLTGDDGGYWKVYQTWDPNTGDVFWAAIYKPPVHYPDQQPSHGMRGPGLRARAKEKDRLND